MFRLLVDGVIRGSGASITGSGISYNGQDGIDSGFTDSFFAYSVFNSNGWLGLGGDRSGILLCNATGSAHTGTVIDGNSTAYNGEHGILLAGGGNCSTPVQNVVVTGNLLFYNGQAGAYFLGNVSSVEFKINTLTGNGTHGLRLNGSMSSVQVNNNTASSWPTYNCIIDGYPGVTYFGNTCS